MSNSSLVNYIKISPNSTNPRSKKISKITIHHMAGNLTVEQCGEVFEPKSRQASSNYGIGTDGRVGLYVEEHNRSWASSSPENDHMAVTIEVANDGGANWHVSDKALAKTIDLCTDICERNGIKELKFTGDKTGNLTMHKYFAATACPGPYLESKFPYIAEMVNKRLSKGIIRNELEKTPEIVGSLSQRGIMTNAGLWTIKMTTDINAYWLARKIANMTVNKKRATDLKTVNDIVWELNQRGIITDSKLWLKLMNEDKDLYWLAFKACNMTVNKGGFQ
jgi:hypothetical protein